MHLEDFSDVGLGSGNGVWDGQSMADKEGLATKFGHWTAVYGAYLFLAGWSYLKFYFRVFGVDTSWLDLGFNETIARGFSVLFGTGAYLSIIYLVVFVVSVCVEVFSKSRNRFLETAIPLFLVTLFPATYFVARLAGIEQANSDRGNQTSLPTLTFAAAACDYGGKLVYVKGELFYIYNLAYLSASQSSAPCPFDVTNASQTVPQVWIVRSQELKDIRLVHYQKEAKP
jgi:hypothetical protein